MTLTTHEVSRMRVLAIRHFIVAPRAEAIAPFLDALGLPRRALERTPAPAVPQDGADAVSPADDPWIGLWPSGPQVPPGTLLQIVVDDADAFARRAREHGLTPEGPTDAHGERSYLLQAPDGVQVSFQSAQAAAPAPEAARPAVWVGHVSLETARLADTAAFMRQIGMRSIFEGPAVAIFELRGGTHLIALARPGASPREAGFDLMVDDLHAAHARFAALGLAPSAIEAVPAIDHERFSLREPGGNAITFFSSHVSGRAV